MISFFEAELVGALTGDGFIGVYGPKRNKFVVQLTGDARYEKEYFLYLKEILNSIIISKSSFQEKDENTLHMRTYSKELFNYFHNSFNFPIGKKGNISVPKQILQNHDLMKHFIRGLFDTDGTLFFDKRKIYAKPYPRLIIYTTSHNLFKEVNSFLKLYFKVGFTTSKRKERKRCYCIEIYGHKQLEKWKQLIGFSNLKHICKLPS